METNKLNNQMILMRKNFKKAKVHVISKLVRQIRLLRNKKGSDAQIQKHNNRADRLVEEIDIIKDLKPDKIFKHLLSLDEGQKPIGHLQDVTIQDRALARIGLVPFIKQKMDEIREQVASFDFVRSKKGSVTAIRVSSKLAKIETLTKENASTETENERNQPMLNQVTTSSEIKSLVLESPEPNPSNRTLPSTSTKITLKTNESLDSQRKPPTFQPKHTSCDISDNADSSEDESANSYIDQLQDPTPQSSETTKTQNKPLDITTISHTDNITEVLENIGKGFCDSENEQEIDENSTDEDLAPDDEAPEPHGGSFFMDSLDSKPRRPVNERKMDSKNATAKSSHMKSSFVTSLSHSRPPKSKSFSALRQDGSEGPRKKKNRLGQRARQKLYGSTNDIKPRSKDSRGRKSNFKGKGDETRKGKDQQSSKSRKEEFTEKENSGEIHPSWQASQARKQQLQIQSFQGKRIKFDDSD